MRFWDCWRDDFHGINPNGIVGCFKRNVEYTLLKWFLEFSR